MSRKNVYANELENGWTLNLSDGSDECRDLICISVEEVVERITAFLNKEPDTKKFLQETGAAGFVERLSEANIPAASEVEDTIKPL